MNRPEQELPRNCRRHNVCITWCLLTASLLAALPATLPPLAHSASDAGRHLLQRTSMRDASGPLPGTVLERDRQGRPIHFEARAAGADTRGYARILAAAPHGDEISHVRIIIAPRRGVDARCGRDAEACYEWSLKGDRLDRATIIVSNGTPATRKRVLLHEYAHHLDASRRSVGGGRILDGTPAWFVARNVQALVAAGHADLYRSGTWDRAVGEIFAEDYVALNDRTAPHRISELGPPSPEVLQALARDLGTTLPFPS